MTGTSSMEVVVVVPLKSVCTSISPTRTLWVLAQPGVPSFQVSRTRKLVSVESERVQVCVPQAAVELSLPR